MTAPAQFWKHWSPIFLNDRFLSLGSLCLSLWFKLLLILFHMFVGSLSLAHLIIKFAELFLTQSLGGSLFIVRSSNLSPISWLLSWWCIFGFRDQFKDWNKGKNPILYQYWTLLSSVTLIKVFERIHKEKACQWGLKVPFTLWKIYPHEKENAEVSTGFSNGIPHQLLWKLSKNISACVKTVKNHWKSNKQKSNNIVKKLFRAKIQYQAKKENKLAI